MKSSDMVHERYPSRQINADWVALGGFLLFWTGIGIFLLGAGLGVVRNIVLDPAWLRSVNEFIVWYSGLPVALGGLLLLGTGTWRVGPARARRTIRTDRIDSERMVVGLIAFNEEESIHDAVHDFLNHPRVEEVVVVDNNSTDSTAERAREAGAVVVHEPRQGYGACCWRALYEASHRRDLDVCALCEADRTFRAWDLDKMLAYIPHADIVNGTRTVDALQEKGSQLSLSMQWGNFFVAKMLEMKYLGNVTLTDVGTTYKVCRIEWLRDILESLDRKRGLDFNPYFLDRNVLRGATVVECPITFFPRVGKSKGGNINTIVAAKLGFRMMWGIVTNWKGR